MLLLWLRMLLLLVHLITVIPCSGVTVLWILVSCNVFKRVLLELLPTPPRTHTSLLLERPSLGCILNIVLYLRLPYWSASAYKVVIQNDCTFFLNIVFILHVKAKLMACCLRSHTLPLQYVSLLRILASALLIMLQRFGMICLMMYPQPLHSTHSERNSKPISLQKHTPYFFPTFSSGTDFCYVSG